MGRHSLARYQERFDPDRCIARLATDVISLVEQKRRGLL